MASLENCRETTPNVLKRKLIMFDSVLFCARQGIYMKGQIKKPLYQYSDDENSDDGQAVALSNLFWKVSNGDPNPSSQSRKSFNATNFLTKQTQDHILETCGEMLTARLVAEVKEAQFFSLIAEKVLKDDEGIRIPFFVRFVDKDSKIREQLLQFIPRGNSHPDESLAETFGNNILQGIDRLGLNMEFCRGLNFDSGNNVGDLFKVVEKIQSNYPKATYIHARFDLLNACIVSTCKVWSVWQMFYKMRFTATLFAEEKEIQEFFKLMIRKVMPDSEIDHLIELSHINWSSNVQQFAIWVKLFPAIITTYDEIHEGRIWIRDSDKCSSAVGASLVMQTFEFVICMVIVANCVEITTDLTEELQKVCYDSNLIRTKVSEVYMKLNKLKANIKEHHSAWYEKAIDLAREIDITPAKAERYRTKLTKHKTNPDESISEHYLNLITLPFIDHLEAQLKLRFTEASLDALDGVAMMPSNVVANPGTWKTAASRFTERYKSDLPNYADNENELRLWEMTWKDSAQKPPETALELLSDDSSKKPFRSQLERAFKIFATMPIVPTESETPRLMPYINEELCLYSMSDSYLNALALMSIRGKELETEDVIECYQKKYTLDLD
ncbi:52 kDa repressor of the inhibitor of the protein kinase-like [Dendronephthya gigantea]|uniref:52 kDa repressor of the inhibitor of the protein kinase-like n=1 Tax=Dendronephthya gigantea TaxID=151771 RepID=UPI00106CF1DA|nr:52 kDa repressor of the inhibitor of the protein kinase-like [Dendronephthya gigantea]